MVACLLDRLVGTADRAGVLVSVVRPVVVVLLLGEAEADEVAGAMCREGASSDPTGNKRRSDAELVRAEVSSSGEEEPPCVGSGVLVIFMTGKPFCLIPGWDNEGRWKERLLSRERRARQEGGEDSWTGIKLHHQRMSVGSGQVGVRGPMSVVVVVGIRSEIKYECFVALPTCGGEV